MQKRKRSQKGSKKVLRPRTDIGARATDVGSSENELDSEGEIGINAGNKNNDIPTGNREGTNDVKEAIKTIGIIAGGTGRGYKQTTDKVMQLFINVHMLCGRKHCCCFHSNHFYRTAEICKSFILDLRFWVANHFPSLSSAEPPPCCAHCMPKDPLICCNICHTDLFFFF